MRKPVLRCRFFNNNNLFNFNAVQLTYEGLSSALPLSTVDIDGKQVLQRWNLKRRKNRFVLLGCFPFKASSAFKMIIYANHCKTLILTCRMWQPTV